MTTYEEIEEALRDLNGDPELPSALNKDMGQLLNEEEMEAREQS